MKRVKHEAVAHKKPVWRARLVDASTKTARALGQALPILFSVLILISLAIANIPKEWYTKLFTGTLLDPVIGATAGSVAAGNPITSYIIGGELLKNGISLVAVTAFILSWVTVGFIQYPAESLLLGKRFALVRNITAFLISILIAILTVATLKILGVLL